MYNLRRNVEKYSTRPSNAPFTQQSNNYVGTQPSYADRRAYTQYNPSFAGIQTLVLSSSNRASGSISQAVFRLPQPIVVYACSIKSFTLPVSWPNVSTAQTLTVTYTYSGSPQGYPTTVTIPVGNYTYSMNMGQITYSYVNSQASYVNKNDLTWYLLRQFAGALSSITIDPTTGGWTWAWNSGTLSAVTSTSSSVTGFLQISSQSGTTWSGISPVDLTGPRTLTLNCPELDGDAYITLSTSTDSYIAAIQVDKTFGQVLTYEPSIELVNWYSSDKPISQFTISIMDPSTNTIVPLSIDYTLELRFYVNNSMCC